MPKRYNRHSKSLSDAICWDNFDVGCWVDSSRGINYTRETVQEFALEEGWTGLEGDGKIIRFSKDAPEEIEFAFDEAEEYLNALLDTIGVSHLYFFGFSNGGDWGLWKVNEEDFEDF